MVVATREGRTGRVRALRFVAPVAAVAVVVPLLTAVAPAAPPDPGSTDDPYADPDWREKRQKQWPEIEHTEPLEASTFTPEPAESERLITPAARPVVWPEPGVSVIPVAPAGAAATPGQVVRAHKPADSADEAGSPERVSMEVLDRRTAQAVAVDGLLLRVRPESEPGGGGEVGVEVSVDYSGFAHARGGDWAARLRLVALPECAVTTPNKPGCQTRTPVESVNEVDAQTVTATVDLATMQVLALEASTSGPTGNWAATSLTPSASWEVSGNTGSFTWSYPLRTPPAVGGPSPELALAYSSGSIDGRVASTNNQTSWVGDGWELWPGYIERRYVSCADDMSGGNNSSRKTGDLCWKSDNASIVFGGIATELIKDETTGVWRLKNDDGSRIEKITGGDNPDNNGEYWKLTTKDGVQYFFGVNKRTASDTGRTNSVWTVPVFGNHSGEPCRASAFADSSCTQAWRWNLDYVVDLSGNTMSYFYTRESNRYGLNLNEQSVSYTRGGYLTRVDYGQRQGTEHTTPAPMRVLFDTAERCLSNCDTLNSSTADRWPDVPYDLICSSTSSCADQLSPSFFTRKRLTGVRTQVRSGTTYRAVDEWTLTHKFPDPGDGTNAVLWLDSVKHTGRGNGSIALPAVSFTGVQMENRVDAAGDIGPAMVRYRISSIDTESGGRVTVNYTSQDCSPSSLPSSPDSNTRRCFPVYWAPDGQPADDPVREYFHKYVVTSVMADPRTTNDVATETHYSYGGGTAWRYDNDEMIPAAQRTWGQFRGYKTVTVTTGAPTDPVRSRTVTTYLRGMHGDKLAAGGTKSVTVTDSEGGTHTDYDHYSGRMLEQITYNGVGGAEVTGVINTMWRSAATATNERGVQARLVGTGVVDGRETAPDLPGGVRRTQVTTAFDGTYGLPTEIDDRGDVSTTADDVCIRYTYSRNTSKHIVAAVSRTEEVSARCSATPSRPADVISDTRVFYDGGSFGAAPTRGLVTKTQEVDRYSSGSPVYVTVSEATYDTHGRVLSAKDALGRQTSTAYTPASGGPLTQITVTNPAGHAITTLTDPAWGVPTKITDPNGKITEATYDALGRLTAVWLPGRLKGSASPHTEYAYLVRTNGPNAVTTRSLTHDGSYTVTTELFDGLLRPRQSQATSADGAGRLVTDLLYDRRGLVEVENHAWFTTGTPSTSLLIASVAVPGRTRYVHDGAGRVTTEIFEVAEQERWRTSTQYRGDRVAVTPPTGGTPQLTISDARGRVTQIRQYLGATPSGTYQATTYTYDHAGRLGGMTDPAGNAWSYGYDMRGRQITSTDPDRGVWSSTYDAAGQLLTNTDARGETLAYVYDALGRQVELRKNSATGPLRASWVYDSIAKGQLTSATRHHGGAQFVTAVTGYDHGYRPTGQSVTIPAAAGLGISGTFTTEYTYTVDGLPKTIKHPAAGGISAETVTTYYRAGVPTPAWMSGGLGFGGYVAGTEWSPYGEPLFMDIGTRTASASMLSYSYEHGTRRLDKAWLTRPGVSGYDLDVTYAYDPAGNVTKVANAPTASGSQQDVQCYSYDGLRRLTEAWTPASGNCAAAPSVPSLGGAAPYWLSWTFDQLGNRLTQTRHATAGNTVDTYTYPSPGQPRPHAPTLVQTSGPGGSSSRAYGYDTAGHTTARDHNGATQTLAWNPEGRVDTITGAAGTDAGFIYTADGERLVRRQGSTVTVYLPAGVELEHNTGTGTTTARRYYTFAGRTVVVRNGTGLDNTSALISDHHETAQLSVRASTGQIIRRYMDPYGNPRGPQPLGWVGDHGFLDKPTDTMTGLTHIGAREYDPLIGRFISVDPIMDLADPQQWHGYAYANNNPVTWSDPTGLRPIGDDHGQLVATPKTGGGYTITDSRNQPPVNPPPPPPGPSTPTDQSKDRGSDSSTSHSSDRSGRGGSNSRERDKNNARDSVKSWLEDRLDDLDPGVLGACATANVQLGIGNSRDACAVTDFRDTGFAYTEGWYGGPSASMSATVGVSWSSARSIDELAGEAWGGRVGVGEILGGEATVEVTPSDDGLLGLPFNIRVNVEVGASMNYTPPIFPAALGFGRFFTRTEDW